MSREEEGLQNSGGQSAGGRRGDGGVYLVVADDTDEFSIALRYAVRRAETSRAHVGIVHVTDENDFQHWGNVEAMMMRELRDEAEKKLWSIAKKINEINGLFPVFYIREGGRIDQIIETINEEDNIRMLILGASAHGNAPGPLVSHFTGKGLARLRVPVLVVPGHLEHQRIDALAM